MNKSMADKNHAQKQCDEALKAYIRCTNSLILTEYVYVPVVKVDAEGEHFLKSSTLEVRERRIGS